MNDAVLRCAHCNEVIQEIVYALGPQWMHVDPNASFPTIQRGTAWQFCRNTVATPKWKGPKHAQSRQDA